MVARIADQVLLRHARLVELVVAAFDEDQDVLELVVVEPVDVRGRLRQGVGDVPDDVLEQLPVFRLMQVGCVVQR